MNCRRYRALVVLGLAASCGGAYGGTAAYWRHEEGTVGSPVAQGPDTVLDSANNNHMRTFGPGTAGTYSSSVSPLALRSGLPNTKSIDFGPGGDNAGLDDDNYTDTKLINVSRFNELTVELAFNMD